MTKKVSRFLIEFPIWMFVLETISFCVGWHITIWPFIISFAGLMSYELWKENSKTGRYIFAAIVIVCLLFSIVIMSSLYDTSYDGQWYHSAVILLQQNGWNPFCGPIITPDTEPFGTGTHLWVSHYAKGIETIESGFVAVTGNLESGKAYNLLLVLSMLGYIYGFLKSILPQKKKWTLIGFTLLIAANPVVINQLFTHYIDYTCYVFVLIGCILIYDVIILKNKRSVTTLLLLGFFIPSIKMNIAFWIILIMCVCLVVIWLKTRIFDKSVFIKMAAAVLLGVLVGGFNPYVTNTYLKGNVLYPLNGSKREVVERNSMPDMMWGKSRLYQANYSLLVNPYSNDAKRHGNTHVFSVSKEDVMDSARHDVQLGGFGIFFFELIVLLLILYFTLPKSSNWKYAGVALILLYGSLFLLPSGSLARYVPFFFLFPIIIIGLALTQEKLKVFQKLLLGGGIAFISLNAFISISGVSAMVVQQKLQHDYIVKELKNYGGKVYVSSPSCQIYDKLERADIKYTLEKPRDKQLYEIDMVGCDPIIDVPASVFKEEDQPLLMKKIKMFQLKISEYKKKSI